ncbi:MAG TPA: hypothetical protein PKE45_01590 [Caldilineaceae bacterium]|nr:hypothetical protein [Caldilineaceae bacterium]
MSTQTAAPADQTQPSAEAQAGSERLARIAELITVILLSVTTLATAFSAYQGAAWGTQMSLFLGQASAKRMLASRATATANQLVVLDINLFTNWLNAYAGNNTELATFYVQRFRPEFQPAFDAWLATQPRNNPAAPKSPFAMPEYQVSQMAEATRLDGEAEALTEAGLDANDKRDAFALSTVLLASVLFFVGMSQRLKSRHLRIALVLVGALLFLFVVFWDGWLLLA